MNTTPVNPPRHLIRWLIVGIIGMVLLTFLVLHLVPVPPLELGPDTTVISAPLHADGTPNYFEALEALRSAGVTPENNAAVLLLQVWGPGVFDGIPLAKADEVLQSLGLSRADLTRGPHLNRDSWQRWIEANMQPPEDVLSTAGMGVPASGSYVDIGPPEDDDWYSMDFEQVIEVLEKYDAVHPQLEPWLEAHEPAFKRIEEASRRPRIYFPLVSDRTPPNLLLGLLPHVVEYHGFSQALRCRALLRMHQNDVTGSWHDVLTIKRLAAIPESSPLLLDYFVRDSLLNMVGTELGLELAIAGPPLSAEDARGVLSELLSLAAGIDHLTAAFDTERYFGLDTILLARRGDADMLYGELPGLLMPWDANHVLRAYNEYYDRHIASLKLPTYIQRHRALQDLEGEVRSMPGSELRLPFMGSRPLKWRAQVKLWTLKAIGAMGLAERSQLMAGISLGYASPISIAERHSRSEVLHNLLVLALALSIHHAEAGAYPEHLQQLAPGILPQVPLDTFSDKPFIYQRTADGYLLYSVGENMIDDGGTNEDIVVKFPPEGRPQ